MYRRAIVSTVAFSAALVLFSGCAGGVRQVRETASIQGSEKVIIGDVALEDDFGALVGQPKEPLVSAPQGYLRVDYAMKVKDGKACHWQGTAIREPASAELLGADLGETGRPFHAAVAKKPVYLLGLEVRAGAKRWWVPLNLRIDPSSGTCDYVGTIVVGGHPRRVAIRDDFQRKKFEYENLVKGCSLVRNLAHILEETEIAALEK